MYRLIFPWPHDVMCGVRVISLKYKTLKTDPVERLALEWCVLFLFLFFGSANITRGCFAVDVFDWLVNEKGYDKIKAHMDFIALWFNR